jgi:hypothetical protein
MSILIEIAIERWTAYLSGGGPTSGPVAALVLLTMECRLEREGTDENPEAALLDGLRGMSALRTKGACAYLGSEELGCLHLCLLIVVAA